MLDATARLQSPGHGAATRPPGMRRTTQPHAPRGRAVIESKVAQGQVKRPRGTATAWVMLVRAPVTGWGASCRAAQRAAWPADGSCLCSGAGGVPVSAQAPVCGISVGPNLRHGQWQGGGPGRLAGGHRRHHHPAVAGLLWPLASLRAVAGGTASGASCSSRCTQSDLAGWRRWRRRMNGSSGRPSRALSSDTRMP